MQFFNTTMAPMYQNFKKYGNTPGAPAQFDYGGNGGFDPTVNGAQYEQMTKEIMSDMWNRSGGDLGKFIQMWRGVPADKDPRYFQAVQGAMK